MVAGAVADSPVSGVGDDSTSAVGYLRPGAS